MGELKTITVCGRTIGTRITTFKQKAFGFETSSPANSRNGSLLPPYSQETIIQFTRVKGFKGRPAKSGWLPATFLDGIVNKAELFNDQRGKHERIKIRQTHSTV